MDTADDWQNKVHSLSLRAKFALDNKIQTDCEFTFDGNNKIGCHKLILAMTSPVFYAMFYGKMKYQNDQTIEIADVEHHVFKQLTQYIYTGQSGIIDCRNACDLYHAAKKYLLLHLEKQCIEYLLTNVNKENVIQIYEFSQFHGEEELEKRAVKEIQSHASSILKEEAFLQASEETVSTLLESERLNISSECELLSALERWAQAQYSNESSSQSPRSIADRLIKKLRLLTVTKQEFITGVATSTLLSDSEKLSLLLRIIESDYPPMLNGLCEKRIKRKPCREIRKAILNFEEISEARCDGSEWFTSTFVTTTRLVLLGIERSPLKPGSLSYSSRPMNARIASGGDTLRRLKQDETREKIVSRAFHLHEEDNLGRRVCLPSTNCLLDKQGQRLKDFVNLINLQVNEDDGVYKENLMTKVSLAHKEDHFAEGNLLRTVPYNTKVQVMLSKPPVLEPAVQYSVHLFLCSPGIYPLGSNNTLASSHNNIEFLSHTSWEQCHPWNTTVLSSLILTDIIET